MNKNLLIVFLLFFTTGLYAQWDVLDGSALPSDNTPAFGASCNDPGPNTIASIVPDLDIPGNNLLDYLSPDQDGRMAYKLDFTTWTGTDFTAVIRMRGYPGIDSLTYLFDLEIRNGNAGLREKLFVKYDNTIELDNSNASADLGYDVHEWHTYRITMSGADVAVYVDEATTPIISGVTTNTTSDLQLKIADCSGGNSNGAQVDWMAWTTEGAYAPGSGPALPADLFTGGGGNDFNASDYSIAFLTKEVDEFGDIEEQGLITDLRERGFTVDVTYNNTVQYTTDFDFSFEALNNYDLVILGRGVSSGDFTAAPEWAAVETPIITFSAYLMRSTRLQLINSSSASRETPDGTTVAEDRVTNVEINSTHPVFNGMDSDLDGEIGYITWFYDYIGYGADTFEMNHNATLLATLKHENGPGDGTVAMAYWETGVETYPGGPTLAGKRATFLMGSDDNSDPKIRNFTAFTPESTIAFHNLMKYLLGATPDGVEIPFIEEEFSASDYSIAFLTKEVDDLGAIEEQGLITDLRQRGFTVDVTYNNTVQYTTDFDFSFEALNNYDLVILGRGVSSGDFTAAPEWAAVETPIITFSAYLMRSTRLQLINSSSASRETPDGTTVAEDRVTNVEINSTHPVFNGMDSDLDGEIGYITWFYDYIGYGADTFEMNHNATLLATLKHENGPGDGTVAMAYWETGVDTYPGGPILAGKRATFLMGSDDNSDPKIRNFTAFTPESTIAFHNLMKFLLGETPDGVEIPLSGPVAHYNMDGTGETVSDAIGGANGMIMNGNGITREDCGINNSINFAGAVDQEAVIWVEDAPSINFDGSSSFSISIWAKVDPYTNTDEMTLLLKGDNGMSLPNGNGHWYALATKDNEIRFAIDDAVTKTQLGVSIDETVFSAAEWNHIVGVVDAVQDSLFLYLNGAKIGSVLNETDMDMSTTGLPLVIGNYHSSVRKINGSIDELGIYDRALDDDEIAMLFANAAPTNTCTVLETISGSSNDATLSALTVDVGTLNPTFGSDIFDYTVELPIGTNQVLIVPTANDQNAVAVGGGVFNTLPGIATIAVTAEDGFTTQDYTISFDFTTSIRDLEAANIALEIYPNPFNNLTNLSFHLEESADVNLTIYDMVGKEIKSIVNADFAAGDHSIEFSTADLKAGIYLYQFSSAGIIITNKMIKK